MQVLHAARESSPSDAFGSTNVKCLSSFFIYVFNSLKLILKTKEAKQTNVFVNDKVKTEL